MAALFILVPTTILFLVAIISIVKNAEKSKVSDKFPSGNSGLPFVGETFGFLKPHLATTRGEFMELHISRFGRIFSSNVLMNKVIVSADAELNRFVQKNDTKLFVPGWPSAFRKVIGEGSIALTVGDAYKKMRSVTLEFLSNDRIRSVFLREMDRAASSLMSSWKEGRVFSAKGEATKFSMYVMVKKLVSMDSWDPEVKQLLIDYDRLIRGFSTFPLYLPGTTYWSALKSRKSILKIFKKEMEKRKGDNKDSRQEDEDFLGFLMKNTNYSHEKTGDMLLSLLFAGHDTSSRAISALIYFLHNCPSAVEQLREEHLQVITLKKHKGESTFTWDDYKGLEFTKCVINETLRLSSVSIAVPKKATEDIEFNGYVIPRGCNVLLHYKAVHLDPLLYKDPEIFNPWRWLSLSSMDIANNFMPFGGGPRYCPSSEFARLQMAVFLHHLILKYEWELAEPDPPMSNPFMEFPKGLPIKVRAYAK